MFSFKKKSGLLSAEEESIIVAAIKEAEVNTSGEIRVFIESKCSYVDSMDRAKEIFFKLNMQHTENKNGVLIYVALLDRQLAIYGDEGIYKQTGGDPYWKGILEDMRTYFRKEEYAEGIASAAIQIGEALATHFPYDKDTDINELPDEIVFGK